MTLKQGNGPLSHPQVRRKGENPARRPSVSKAKATGLTKEETPPNHAARRQSSKQDRSSREPDVERSPKWQAIDRKAKKE